MAWNESQPTPAPTVHPEMPGYTFTTGNCTYTYPYFPVVNMDEKYGKAFRIAREIHKDGNFHYGFMELVEKIFSVL